MARRTLTPPPHRRSALAERFAAIRRELEVDEAFPSAVIDEATAAAERGVGDLPDATGVPFVTLDPPGSRDLDQAMCLERDGAGYRVRYAIADVPAFVGPGGAVDHEARRRGVTLYCPDRRVPLHPPVLSEGAASLLPGAVRPAFVWDLRIAGDGRLTDLSLDRRLVRSGAQLDYPTVQAGFDAGAPDPRVALLARIGPMLAAREADRGGASLSKPQQEIHEADDGTLALTLAPPLVCEEWNAQISLLTGMAAARLMLDGGVGVLRTMPPPDDRTLARLRRQAAALGVPWPADLPYGAVLRSLDRTHPGHLALVYEAAALYRGAAYTAFDGPAPAEPAHAAVAAPYAHVTAPLRRLVDRFALVVCLALAGGRPVPDWARAALPELPEIMAGADRRSAAVERACVDAVEAALLTPLVGQDVPATVVDVGERGDVVVQFDDLGVVARASGRAAAGARVAVRVDAANVARGTVGLTVPTPRVE